MMDVSETVKALFPLVQRIEAGEDYEVVMQPLMEKSFRKSLRALYEGSDQSYESYAEDNEEFGEITWELIESAADAVNLGCYDEV